MNTEQVRELVLRKHNNNGGFTSGETAMLAEFIKRTYYGHTEEEEKVNKQIHDLFPELWFGITSQLRKSKKPYSVFTDVSASLLVKLGSLVVHYEEWTSNTGHPLDKSAIDALMNDEEVVQWFKAMKELALLPQKR